MNISLGFYHDRLIGFTASFLLHVALFALGGVVFMRPIEYAVELGTGGLELSLVAAPAEPISEFSTTTQEPPKLIEEEPLNLESDDRALPQHDIEGQKLPKPRTSPHKGDGSSPVPGKDAATFYSAGGAIAETKPNYLRNPAPPYPWEAREKGWQGIIILKIDVDKSGNPTKVEKEKSTGYDILDEAALKAVRKWRFRPAQLGALPVDSSVRVPIRFQLES